MSRPSPVPNLLDVVYAGALALASPVLAWNLARTGKWRSDWRARLGHVDALPDTNGPTVLLHGVSVGEVAAIAPLVDRLADTDSGPGARVVVSSTTLTGIERARSLFAERHPVVHYPIDFSRSVGRFLDRVRPDVVALVELEVWPNLIRACEARGIPVVVVNGRISQSSIPTYRRFRPLLAPSFGRLFGVAVQTERYADRFEEMGVARDRVRVADSLKWEVQLPDGVEEAGVRLRQEMGVDSELPLVVAFSTGPGEEARLLEGRPDGVQLMVVPRKPERFEEVAALAPWIRRTDAPSGASAGELFLLDTMGEAEAAIAAADVVLVGRSWNGLGGSNPIPAARLGRPIVCGPDDQNFTDMVDALRTGGALVVASDPWAAAREILDDPARLNSMAKAGPSVVRSRVGATARNLALVLDALDAATGRGSAAARPPG